MADIKVQQGQIAQQKALQTRGPEVKRSFAKDGLAIAQSNTTIGKEAAAQIAGGKKLGLPALEEQHTPAVAAKGAKTMASLVETDDDGKPQGFGGFNPQQQMLALIQSSGMASVEELESIEKNLGSIGAAIQGREGKTMEQIDQDQKALARLQEATRKLEQRSAAVEDANASKAQELIGKSAAFLSEKGVNIDEIAGALRMDSAAAGNDNVAAKLAATSAALLQNPDQLMRAMWSVQQIIKEQSNPDIKGKQGQFQAGIAGLHNTMSGGATSGQIGAGGGGAGGAGRDPGVNRG